MDSASLRVPCFNRKAFWLWKIIEQSRYLFGPSDPVVRDQVDEVEKLCGGGPVVLQVHRTWMNGFVSNYPDDVECFLNVAVHPLSDQRGNIRVYIVTWLP